MLYVVIPALRLGGGSLEALRMTKDVIASGNDARLVSLWTTPNPMPTGDVPIEFLSFWRARRSSAAWQYIVIWFRFASARLTSASSGVYVFTHYVTLPLAWAVSRERRIFFVQDLEWKFMSRAWMQRILRKFVLFHYRRGRVVPANEYLAASLRAEGIQVDRMYPIWADHRFLREDSVAPWDRKDIDVCIMLRKGSHKREDLQREFLELAIAGGTMRIAIISPDAEPTEKYAGRVAQVIVNPGIDAMADLYARARLFLLLSEHEGFGLPPLEAMGSGCVPICRDAGGVRSYLDSPPLRKLIVDLSVNMGDLLDFVEKLVSTEELRALSAVARERFRQGMSLEKKRQETALFLVKLTS